jgi:hypothetical protein
VMAPIPRNVSVISWCDIWSILAVESCIICERSAITSNSKKIISIWQNVKYHKGKAVNFQTHHRVIVLIPSKRVRGTGKHPRRVRNRRCRLWWDVHHARPSPRGVPLDVHLPSRVVVGPDLLDQVLQRASPTVHVRLHSLSRRKTAATTN